MIGHELGRGHRLFIPTQQDESDHWASFPSPIINSLSQGTLVRSSKNRNSRCHHCSYRQCLSPGSIPVHSTPPAITDSIRLSILNWDVQQLKTGSFLLPHHPTQSQLDCPLQDFLLSLYSYKTVILNSLLEVVYKLYQRPHFSSLDHKLCCSPWNQTLPPTVYKQYRWLSQIFF